MELEGVELVPFKPRDGFEIVDRVGRGAFGDVFLCQRQAHGDSVCVKEVDLQLLSPVERRGCLEEAAVLRRLPRHPHIISLLDAFRDQDSPNLLLLVLEFADAGDLAGFLLTAHDADDGVDREAHQQHRRLSRQLFTQIVQGVAFLHARNVLHRDLKPQNVLLFRSTPSNSNPDGLRAVVADFGSSKTLSSTTALAQTVVGSPLYMSPELLESEPHGTPTDIWSLGCLLYELLTGQPPFRAPSYPAVVRKITRGEYVPLTAEQSGDEKVTVLVDWMLQRDPGKRPTAAQVLSSLMATGPAKELTESPVASEGEASGTPEPTTGVDTSGECIGNDNVVATPPPAPVQLRPAPPEASDSTSEAAQVMDSAVVASMPQQEHDAAVRPLHPTQRTRRCVDTSETPPLPPPIARARTPALRPSFLPKSSTVTTSTTIATRTSTSITKRKPVVDINSSNSVRMTTTASDLLVVGVRVSSKRPPALSKLTQRLHK